MSVITNICRFWVNTWKQSKTLFIAEAVGSITGMAASATMALYAPDPNLLIVFILYEISAALLMYAAYVRESSWIMTLMGFYFVITGVGLFNLLTGV